MKLNPYMGPAGRLATPPILAKPLGLAISWELVLQKELGPCPGPAEGSRHSHWPALQQWPWL